MATEAGGMDLGHAVALLAVGVVAVPIFRKLGLGAVLGYLAAGVAVGPFGFKLFADSEAIIHVAELGVVNRITDGPAIEAARELAATIAANGPLALMATKALMRDSWNWEYDELEKRQNPYIKDVFSSEDAREGASAFAEKRKPVWRGK